VQPLLCERLQESGGFLLSIRDASPPKRAAQFGMSRKPNLSFAVGAVLVAHEAEDGQQLRLRELVSAERRSIAGHRRLSYVQGDARESHQTDFRRGLCGFSPSSRRA
jgi:hypothetical protein